MCSQHKLNIRKLWFSPPPSRNRKTNSALHKKQRTQRSIISTKYLSWSEPLPPCAKFLCYEVIPTIWWQIHWDIPLYRIQLKYLPSVPEGTHSPPAPPHHLQHLTACLLPTHLSFPVEYTPPVKITNRSFWFKFF